MSAALITPISDLSVVNGNADVHLIEINKVTQNDWIELTYPALWFTVTDETGVTEAATYCLGVVNDGSNIAAPSHPVVAINHGATVTAAEISITITTGTKTQWPTTGTNFYVRVEDEIMECSAWTDTTITVRRGAMGTTAATHADAKNLYVLNSIIMGDATINKVSILAATRAVS
jgi:hypothetical protein